MCSINILIFIYSRLLENMCSKIHISLQDINSLDMFQCSSIKWLRRKIPTEVMWTNSKQYSHFDHFCVVVIAVFFRTNNYPVKAKGSLSYCLCYLFQRHYFSTAHNVYFVFFFFRLFLDVDLNILWKAGQFNNYFASPLCIVYYSRWPIICRRTRGNKHKHYLCIMHKSNT